MFTDDDSRRYTEEPTKIEEKDMDKSTEHINDEQQLDRLYFFAVC